MVQVFPQSFALLFSRGEPSGKCCTILYHLYHNGVVNLAWLEAE